MADNRYTISGSSGTAVLLTVTSESKSLSADVTSNAVESGADIADHAVAKPLKYDLSGNVTEAGKIALERLMAARDLVTYTGKDVIGSCIITSLKITSSAKMADAYAVSISLQEVRSVTAQVVDITGLKMGDQGGKMSGDTAKSAKKSSTDGLLLTNDYLSYVSGYNSKDASDTSGSVASGSTGTLAKKTNKTLSKAAPTYSGYIKSMDQ